MEVKQIQVKVTTLNKNLFKQMPKARCQDYNGIPIIHGWVNFPDETYIISQHNGQMAKMDKMTLWDVWMSACPKEREGLNMEEAVKKFNE